MNRLKLTLGFTLLLLLAFVGAASASAQTSKGILAGTTRDASGAVLPGATVTLKGEQTGETRTIVSGSDGQFRAEALSPEPYTVMATHAGFSNVTAEHVVVNPSAVTNYTLTLAVGSVADTVTVEADQVALNTTNGQLSQTINASEITTLPVLSLNPYELAVTIPGVQSVNGANQFENGANSQVNGARPRSNNFLLDSQEINDIGIGGQAFQPQILDLYQDLTVITSTATAEFGRAGGGIFNLVTRSGSNTFHGDVYDRYAGSGLNSLDSAIRGSATPKARFDTHTIGFTGGGPIIKDKLFVFGGAQFERFYGREQIAPVLLPDAAGQATLASLTNPTAASQNAVLTNYLINYSYLTNYTLASNLGTTKINIGPQAGCNNVTAGNCFVEEAYFQRPFPPESSPDTQWSYRVDFHPSQHDQFYVRYLHDRSSLSPDFFANAAGGALGLDTYQGGPSELGAGSWTHIFTGNVLNELRASETRINFLFAPLASTLATPAYALPTLNIAGFPSLGAGQNFPQGRIEDLYQVQDTFSYIRGRQTFRVGFDIGRQLEKDVVAQNAKGTANLANATGAGSALANFLSNQLGNSGTITKTVGPLRVDPHAWRNGVYFQDDVKFSPDFTLNLGVRYDYTSDPENSLQYPAIDPSNVYAPIATVIKVNNDWNNVSPRVGFAWTPRVGGYFGKGKTVVRGGFGIFYDSFFSNFVINAAQSAPNAISGTLTQTSTSGPISISANLNSFNPTLTNFATVTSVDKNLRNPQTYQYNLGIEQEIAKGVILHVAYVGNRGEKLFANQQYNYLNGAGSRLNTTRGIINARGNYADSNYNGLQIDTTARLGRTVNIRANYIFSKDLDDGSEIFVTGDNSTSYSANLAPGGRRQDYGPSAYDHRQFFSVSYAWAPRGFHSENKGLDVLYNVFTRNFTIGGVSQLQSGPYSTVNEAGVDANGDGSAANDRPIIGNPGAPFQTAGIDGVYLGAPTPGTYYDIGSLNGPGTFVQVTPSQVHFLVPYGPQNQFLNQEIGRNTFLNPGSTTHNLAVQKGFSPGIKRFEAMQFVLRAEATNVFNHNDRSYLDTNVLDFGPAALYPTSLNTDNLGRVDTQRTLVLWGKIVF